MPGNINFQNLPYISFFLIHNIWYPMVYIYMFTCLKTTSPHEGNLKLKELEIWYTNFLYALLSLLEHACITAKKRAPLDTFFRNYEPNYVPEVSLSYLQNMPIYYLLGKHTLSICSFLEYCYMAFVFVHNISCPLERCLVYDTNVHKFFPALNLKTICIKPFTFNNTTFSRYPF